MALKWVGALSAATALGAFATANLVPGYTVPVVANVVLVVGAATGVVLIVLAELYQRLDARLSAMAPASARWVRGAEASRALSSRNASSTAIILSRSSSGHPYRRETE